MPGQDALLLQDAEHEIGVDRVAGIAKPPAGVAEPNLLHAVLDLEQPAIAGRAGEQALDAVLVWCWAADGVEVLVARQDLVVNTADPVAAWAHLPVRHGEEVFAERLAEGLENLLDGVERNAADQHQFVGHSGVLREIVV